MKQLPQQLPLFPGEAQNNTHDSSITGVSWSYSRRETFERCLRQYYYEYFGAKKTMAQDDPDKEQIEFLNRLVSRHLRAGKIVHTVIRTGLQKAKEGEYWDVDRLTRWGLSMLRKDRDYSRQYPDGQYIPEGKFPPQLLLEYYYRVGDVETLYDEIEGRIVNALTAFSTSPGFEEFRKGGQQPDSIIEKHFSLKTLNCTIEGQVDLAFRVEDAINIVDWKIGEEDGIGEDSLQLAAYGLWAVEHYDCEANHLRIYKAFLGSHSIVEFSADPNKLEAARVRITQDVERLACVQDYGERGIATAFTPRYEPTICRNCQFQRLCYAD
jgi:CRISPR/Cas system-associated exonuclease Cas4 (RecB family)